MISLGPCTQIFSIITLSQLVNSSEVFRIFLRISAHAAAECVLFAIGRVLDLEAALRGSRAFRQLVARLSRHVVTAALFLVARLAEMGVAPAEPLGYGAAEFALKFDKFLTVLGTSLDATADCNGCAFTAHELFFLEILVVVLGSIAIFHAAEVRVGTLEAIVI